MQHFSDALDAATLRRFLDIQEEEPRRQIAAAGGNMSESASMEDRLRKIIADQLGVPEEQVVPEASFKDDLNADSLEMVDLIIAIEEEFGVQISDEDAEKIKTVQDAYDYLHDRLGE